ncbi:MAG: hypothetical protein C4536_06380 [Actinobacteria bacterium]|nr:MAG: hypothetical protein C4536_06380 [Actinomycetota bacterium]
MRRVIIIALIAVLASSTLALATWKIVDLVQGDEPGSPAVEASSQAGVEAAEEGEAPGGGALDEDAAVAAETEVAELPSGEDTAYTDPDQRYVTETQRHQNFFIALAEGRVKRLDAIATDYQPAGDPNTSYMYFTLTTTDGAKSDGTMVLKNEGGLWRIAAVRQLAGSLGGGTDYVVPAEFEADLAREIGELQEFLTKVAQGRLDYMIVDSVSRPTDTETILTGRVVGIGGRIENTQMTLHKDYSIWHLTNIIGL